MSAKALIHSGKFTNRGHCNNFGAKKSSKSTQNYQVLSLWPLTIISYRWRKLYR